MLAALAWGGGDGYHPSPLWELMANEWLSLIRQGAQWLGK